MAETWINGYDGTVSLTTAHNAKLRVWDGRFSRVVSDVTSFADTGRRRKLGLFDLEGSAGGSMSYDASNTGPGINSTDWVRDGVVLNLGVVGSTACAYTATCVITNIAISVAKDGDSSITFDFANSGGAAPTEAWDETP
jgi:hypothetical protein